MEPKFQRMKIMLFKNELDQQQNINGVVYEESQET